MPLSKQIRPYGTWPSQISARLMGSRVKIDDVKWTDEGRALVWLENRSGPGILVKQEFGNQPIDLFVDQSARGGLLYGGGEFSLKNEQVFFINRGTQLFRVNIEGKELSQISVPDNHLAAPTPSPDGKWLAYIASDGSEDWIAMVDPIGVGQPYKLVSGSDFYMQPAWHPDSRTLAWVEWNHPNMPWDATRIMLANLGGALPQVVDQKLVAGDDAENYTQPLFSPDGRWLSYIASQGDWERLVLFEPDSGKTRVLLEGDRMLFSSPAWVQGVRTTAWSCTSQRLFAIRSYAGRATLLSVEIESGKQTLIDTEPYTWLKQIGASPVGDELSLIASSPQHPEELIRWDGKSWTILSDCGKRFRPPEQFSAPQELRWQSVDGVELHGFYFPPASPKYRGEGAPPMVVNIHGGPTHQEALYFPREAPFFTSRGYAWLDISYRGTIGLGRSYQHALNGRYGELDADDVLSGVDEVLKRGLADPMRLAVFGGSSGGFTQLNLLAKYPHRFRAGICLYPVTDMETLQVVSDKFEAHYLEQLVGPLPESAQLFHDRSPLHHADQIQDPVAIFHGRDDTAVPLSQSEQIAASLRSRGVPVLLQVYDGEGHGFRQAENLEDCFNRIEQFLREWVLPEQ